MTKLKWIFLSAFPLFTMITVIVHGKAKSPDQPAIEPRNGVAIIMTGAAARISQEAALLEELYNRGLMKNVVFISGVSSGALNAVALNGILSGKITWDEYEEILFNLKNSDIFLPQEEKKLPVNTEPARNLFKKIVEEKLGYHQIGDLPYMTVISITNLKDLDIKKKVYRMSSRKINEETDTTLNLVDIMMASTSVPLAFPPVRIQNVKTIPDVEYVDGGVGEDYVPYHALLEFEKFRGKGVEKIYIISKKGDDLDKINRKLQELHSDNDVKLDRLGITFDYLLKKKMVRTLETFAKEDPDLIMYSYVWVPDIGGSYLMFNFENMKDQYLITKEWAEKHDPIPLGNFLLYNKLAKR